MSTETGTNGNGDTTGVAAERAVQNRVIALLKRAHDYGYRGNLKEQENENIEKSVLKAFLTGKQGLSEYAADLAIAQLSRAAACTNNASLYNANKEVYSLLRGGISVRPAAGERNVMAWCIDWKRPERNVFSIAEEVTVKTMDGGSAEHRRPDVVVYVNGIALAVIELKKATVSVADGIRQQWRNQQDGNVPAFFATAQLLVAGSESEGVKYGTTLTPEKYYLQWKEPCGTPCAETAFAPEAFPNPLDRGLLQLLEPKRLLEFIRDGIVFDGGVKKVMRPNQYFCLQAAKPRILAKENGIVWHSQGSGKSLMMVWLAQWIRENTENARVVIVTDRDELDLQIKNGFEAAGETIARAKSGADLLELLGGNAGIVCTLVHKFGMAGPTGDVAAPGDGTLRGKRSPEKYMEELAAALPPGFRPRGNVYVFVDECHRTQGGVLNRAMKKIMGDDVMLIGFTGTPLLKNDKKRITSNENFGPFIHAYKFDEAVRDGVVLDLRYEARDVEQRIPDGMTLDQLFENYANDRHLRQDKKEQLQKRWANYSALFSARDRIRKIVMDICRDMEIRKGLKDGWANAMLVCDGIYSAFRFYDEFVQRGFKGKCAVVTSYDGQEPALDETSGDARQTEKQFIHEKNLEMLGGKTAEAFEDAAKNDFVKNPAKMKLLIVVDKLITGFDAPPAMYLYLDQKMQDHKLFQAICRVNRLNGEDKDYGYIIDYKRLFESIQGAVEAYTEGGAFGGFDREDVDGLMKDRLAEGRKSLDAALELCAELTDPVRPPKSLDAYAAHFCHAADVPAEAVPAELERNARIREDFYAATRSLVRAYTNISLEMGAAGYTQEESEEIFKKVKAYDEFRTALMLRSGDYVDLKGADAYMRNLLDDYVEASGAKTLESLNDFSFLDLLKRDPGTGEIVDTDADATEKMGGKHGMAEGLAANLRHRISRKRDANPEEYRMLSERLNRLIDDYRNGQAAYRDFLRGVADLCSALQAENARDPRLRTPAQKAFYDNVGQDAELALELAQCVRESVQPGFRTDAVRKTIVRRTIENKLREKFPQGDAPCDAETILNIAIHQSEFDSQGYDSEWN